MKITRKKLLEAPVQDRQVKKAEKKKRRRITLAILFITILISTLLWLKNKSSEWWIEFQSPFIYHISKFSDKKAKQKFKNKEQVLSAINSLVLNLRGTYGIYFFDLTNEQFFGINENEIFTSASVNKVPIMVSFYQQVEKGILKEDGRYVLKTPDVQDYGTGTLQYQKPGTKYTYSELVELSGRLSDNTAALVLQNLVGANKIQASLDKLGMKGTSIKDNTTTPKEMTDYFAALYKGSLLKEEYKEKIFAALTNTEFEDRIPKGVPEDVRVVHKIGNEIQVYNDCGIIFADNPYVLCILSKEVAEAEALDVIPKISQILWQFSAPGADRDRT